MGVEVAEAPVEGMKTTAVRVEAVEAHGMPTTTEAQAVVVAQVRRRVAAKAGTVVEMADGVHMGILSMAQRHVEGTRRSFLSKLIAYMGNTD